MAFDAAAFRELVAAQIRAWATTIAKNQGRNLSDPRVIAWIESIVRYRLRDNLGAAPSRMGIPAGAGLSEIGVAVSATGATLTMERGLAMIVSDVLAIYVSDAQAAAWAGAPPAWGWGGSEHAQGVMSTGAYSCATGSAPTWTGAETLSGSDSYSTRASSGEATSWTNDEDRDPKRYTGLMRLAVQCMGPHEDITSWRPSSWPTWNPDYYGLMRQRDATSETLRYWLVYIGPTGARAVELLKSGLTTCLVDGLYAGTWSDEQAADAEEWVLRGLVLPDGATGATLLDDTGVAIAHGDGYDSMAHGWHFSPQVWGTASQDETDAIMLAVATQTNGSGEHYWATRRCVCSFSLDVSTQSASVSSLSSGAVAPHYRHNLWVSSGGYYSRRNFTEYADPQSGDIWATYQNSGYNWVRYSYSFEASKAAQSYRDGLGSCGGGGSSSNRIVTSVTNYLSGGFDGIHASWSASAFTEQKLSLSEGSGSIVGGSFCPDAYGQGVFASWIANGPGASDSECNEQHWRTEPNYDETIDGAYFTSNTAAAIYKKATVRYRADGDHGAALLITEDPTVYVAASQFYKRIQNDWSVETYTINGLAKDCQWTNDVGGGSVSFAWGVSGDSSWGPQGGGVTYTDISNCGDDDGSAADLHLASNADYSYYTPQTDIVGVDNDPTGKTTAVMQTANGSVGLEGYDEVISFSDDKWAAWTVFCRANAPYFPMTGPDAIAGYRGDIVYRKTASSNYTSNAGYDSTAVVSSTFARFLGGG